MQHNSSFGVRFPLILRLRHLLINSLLNNALNDTCVHAKIIKRRLKRQSAQTHQSVTQGIGKDIEATPRGAVFYYYPIGT
jgi:hypothetical protein